MGDYLQRLFDDELDIIADIRLSEKQKELETKLSDDMERFKEMLSSELKERFEELLISKALVQDMYQEEFFRQGYYVAVGLMLDGIRGNQCKK